MKRQMYTNRLGSVLVLQLLFVQTVVQCNCNAFLSTGTSLTKLASMTTGTDNYWQSGLRESPSLVTTEDYTPRAIVDDGKPQSKYDSIIAGGGPAGLMTAIMLSQKFGPEHKIAICERRTNIPASPSDQTVWSDVARFYLLGIGHRGQTCLKKFGVFDDFEASSVAVQGRRDWAPGKTKVEDGRITPAKKDIVSRILARDKLVGVLYYHLLENYIDPKDPNKPKAKIDFLYGYQVEPLDFGSSEAKEDVVTVRISKCEQAGSGSKQLTEKSVFGEEDESCSLDGEVYIAQTKLLVGADGAARTIADAMEVADAERLRKTNPLLRPFTSKPFRVKRYVDDNPRVYKSVPIRLPKDWPCDLNYSARSSDSRITLEALPSDDKGNLCALLLMKPEDELAQPNIDPSIVRTYFEKEFPQFGALIPDEEIERIALKSASNIPPFRYVGPRINMGRRTVLLGDAIHQVKPYYGLGANSALEDVQMLSDAIDDAAVSTSTNGENEGNSIPSAVKLFSKRRSGDASALVTMSRNMDRRGKLFFLCFVLPIILDGIFHKIAPGIFGPNMFGMFQLKGVSFQQIQRKKRLDRALQVGIIGGVLTGAGVVIKSMITVLAKLTGKSQAVVTGCMGLSCAILMFSRKAAQTKAKTT